jgi:hypothetical protein
MDKNVALALDDISLIKTVIERTQQDFSKIAAFFIWIGVINGIAAIVEQLMYFFRNTSGYDFPLVQVFGFSYYWIKILGYVLLFFVFSRKLKAMNNDISNGMLKIWGIVLVGSYLFVFLYMHLMPNGNNEMINTLWKCRELIEILPVIFAFFMTGILTQRRIISIITALYSLVYFVLFFSMKQMPFGTIGGAGTLISVSSFSIRIVMIFGMIALGLFFKIGARNHGNKYNTRSLSNEA